MSRSSVREKALFVSMNESVPPLCVMVMTPLDVSPANDTLPGSPCSHRLHVGVIERLTAERQSCCIAAPVENAAF